MTKTCGFRTRILGQAPRVGLSSHGSPAKGGPKSKCLARVKIARTSAGPPSLTISDPSRFPQMDRPAFPTNIGPVPLSQPTVQSRQSGIRLANRSDLESFFLTSISGVSLLLFRGTRRDPNGLLPSLDLTNIVRLIRQGEVMRSAMHAVVLMTFAGLFVPSSANAQSCTYADWSWSAQYSYYYRKCTFENGYHFYAMYKPSVTKNYIFCYNPYRQRYWCACPTIYHPSFKISSTFISIFIVITNVNDASSVENSATAIPDNPSANTQNKVGMKNANGEPVATLNSMPTDLPAG